MAREFYPLRINDIRRETTDSVSICLDVPEALQDRFQHLPGQFLTFRIEGADGVAVDRSYSICNPPGDGGLRVLVKRIAGGVFGERAHTTMAVGDRLLALPPQGRFTVPLDPQQAKSYLAIAAGSGISPVIAVVRAILGTEPNSQVTLVYGNRDSASVIFRDALCDLKDTYLSRLDVLHVFSREPREPDLLNGRITAAKLAELSSRLIPVTGFDEVFVCGPEPMTLDLRAALLDLGVPAEHVHLELFGSHVAPPAAPVAATAGRVDLEITIGGARRRIDAGYDETVLGAARRSGLDVPFSCTGGVCATCRARVVDGKVTMAVNYSLQRWEIEAGFVLTCQSTPTTPTVTIDYDAI